jgi:hypothetical protein
MQVLDEGFLDFLKRIWYSLFKKKDEFQSNNSDSIEPNDPRLNEKLAKLFVRGLRLHQTALNFKIPDQELAQILLNVWKGDVGKADFLKLKQNGTIDRIYSRVRERIRYQKKKQGLYYEEKK